jgi:hypothetical protein
MTVESSAGRDDFHVVPAIENDIQFAKKHHYPLGLRAQAAKLMEML